MIRTSKMCRALPGIIRGVLARMDGYSIGIVYL